MKTKTLFGQESWVVGNGDVEMAVTLLGGHMGPVVFDAANAPFQPYHISPWQEEKLAVPCPCLVPLRGDFFCLPFGGNVTSYMGERHPPHGETSGSPWKLEECVTRDGVTTLSIALETLVRPGKVVRHLSLVAGHQAVYSRIVVNGFAGAASFAHHAMLRVPENERALLISTSPFDFGLTFPGQFSNPANREYQSLLPSAEFTSLARVPSLFVDQPVADCSAFPVRRGYCDLIQQFEKPVNSGDTPSWVTAVNIEEGWLWYAFKAAALMPGRVFWMENHGRHGSPWSGRNACLGIEDGCMYFDLGVAESSMPNPVSERGVATHVNLDGKPFEIRYIQGAVRIPRGFRRVSGAEFTGGRAVFRDEAGLSVPVAVDHGFLAD